MSREATYQSPFYFVLAPSSDRNHKPPLGCSNAPFLSEIGAWKVRTPRGEAETWLHFHCCSPYGAKYGRRPN